MKNTMPFAALTCAFTVAGAAIGYALHDQPTPLTLLVALLAFVGGFASAVCMERQP